MPTKIVQAGTNVIFLALLLFLLAACQSRTPLTKPVVKETIYPPPAFTLNAKISLLSKQNSYFFSLVWQQKSPENWQLKIVNLVIAWELNIAYKNGTTWVNNQIIEVPLEHYLQQNYHFSFPVNLVRKLLFFPKQEKLVYANWQVVNILGQMRFNNLTAKRIRLQNKQGDTLIFQVLNL